MTLAFIGLLCAAALLGGCGGDDEGGGKTATAQSDTETATTETATTETATAPTERTETQTSTSPEDQPGGAGDEVPARSQALFTGRGGRVSPRVVRVPAYIAIRVELRSGDGKAYALRFNGRILQVDGTVRSVTRDFAGLRPGKALVGTGVNGTNAVRVEATAEPGP